MIDASEAKKRTIANISQRNKRIHDAIDKVVLEAIANCRYYGNVYATNGVSVDMIAEVAKDSGYQWKICRAHDQRDVDYVEIKWA